MSTPFASRLRQRIAELGITQTEAGQRAGLSTSRFGNYVQGRSEPDLATLGRIAEGLETTSDWLIGINQDISAKRVELVKRVLMRDGMAPDRAARLVEVASEAARLLNILPNAADDELRSQMAVQAAWHANAAPARDQ